MSSQKRFKSAQLMSSGFAPLYSLYWASWVAQRLKHLPAMRETWVRSLGREDTLEKEMATHSSILAWKSPWTEEPGRLHPTGSQRDGPDWVTSLSLSFSILIFKKPLFSWWLIRHSISRPEVLNSRRVWPPRNIWQNVLTFLIVTAGGRGAQCCRHPVGEAF